jgi:secreted PhoX family phosphatase
MGMKDDDRANNPTANRHFQDVLEVNLRRRQVLKGGLALAALGFFGVPGLNGL